MTQIIALAGNKLSGKTTAANFLHGHVLKLNEVIRHFDILHGGKLQVNTQYLKDGEVKDDMGELDLTRTDELFTGYASEKIWPYIKLYNFADALKEICGSLFGLTHEQLHGTEKNSLTKLRWENMPGVITPDKADMIIPHYYENTKEDFYDMLIEAGIMVHEPGFMTAREVLQFIGTEIFRRMYEPVWVNLLIERIKDDSPMIAVIADCRFDNEAAGVKDAGGTVVKLTRQTEVDNHKSERGFNKFDDFDKVVDNKNMSIKECNQSILDFLIQKGISELVNKGEI